MQIEDQTFIIENCTCSSTTAYQSSSILETGSFKTCITIGFKVEDLIIFIRVSESQTLN